MSWTKNPAVSSEDLKKLEDKLFTLGFAKQLPCSEWEILRMVKYNPDGTTTWHHIYKNAKGKTKWSPGLHNIFFSK